MAKRRSTRVEEKSVLSRQQVTRSRGTAVKAPRIGVGRDVLAILVLGAAVVSAIALLSYDPNGPASNWAGRVGFGVADFLLGDFGICGFLFPVTMLYSALALFGGGKGKHRAIQMLGLLALVLSGSVLAHLSLSGRVELGYAPGGNLGEAVGELCRAYLSTAGSIVLALAVALGGLVVATRSAVLKLFVLLGYGLHHGGLLVWAGLLVGLKAVKERLLAWNEERRRREIEDEAALAQMLADEEEMVSEDEVAASLAEAAADEAEARAGSVFPVARPALPKLLARKARAREQDPAWTQGEVPLPIEAPVAPETEKRAERKPAPTAAKEKAPQAEAKAPAEKPATPEPPKAPPRVPAIIEPKAPPKPKKEHEEFEFVGDRKGFTLPPLSLLSVDEKQVRTLDKEAFLNTAAKLRAKLKDFGIEGEVVEIRPGPVVTMYEFLPGPGIKVSKIASLADDLAMAMEALRVRIVAPIPGKAVVGIEVPNRERETVYLKEIVEQEVFTKAQSKLTMALGKDIEGMPYVADLAKMPHLLMAGTTGSGKSVSVNAMIMSLLLKATPEEVRFIMVDPKMLELSVYEGIPHLLLPVVTDPKKAALALRWGVEEMERRYQMLADVGVRNIAGYNKLVERAGEGTPVPEPHKAVKPLLVVDVGEGESEEEALRRAREQGVEASAAEPNPEAKEAEPKKLKKLPYIVIIIDELADLMMVASREVETYIARLAQMARAAGIHLMTATQRPSTDVVTGVIKANFPSRISFQLRSKPDSMTILGTVGAEALLGMGDMLILPPTSSHMQRVHGAYVSESDIKAVVDHLKAQGKPVFDESILKPREEDLEGAEENDLSDELYDQALAVVSEMRQVSISMLQRKMRIGYNRAARMIERMERDGLVGAADGARPREVLIRPVGEMPGAGAM